ncbi:MAG: hypothetical protein Q3999_06195 [Buchananella hordeovulneris]|nr:hypothetical protein [Buchananella hordeovulneris]
MYAALFRALPGPKWLKVIEALVLFGVVVFALFQWGFPWFVRVSGINEITVE